MSIKPKQGKKRAAAKVLPLRAREQREPAGPVARPRTPAAPGLPDEARVDGRRVVLEGADEIVLVCGEASITLRRNGKVIIRGAVIDSRARGEHRVRGGSLKLN